MQKQLIVATFILLSPLSLMAQSNDIALFVSSASFSSTQFTDPETPGVDFELEFDRGTGFGASYNRFWSPSVSTEFGYSVLPSDVNLEISDGTNEFDGKVGEAEFTLMTGIVQFHFGQLGSLKPYVGAGVARIEGEIEIEDEELGGSTTEDFNSETTWIANAGVAFGITPSLAFSLDAKYLPYTIEDSESSAFDLDVDPLILSAGLHFRF